MAIVQQRAPVERHLDLRNCLDDLVADGRMDRGDANMLSGTTRNLADSKLHPLTYIAKKNLRDMASPGKTLDEEVLTRWLALKADQPYYHIDPLKINAARVTDVMSFAFAKRHGILCLEVYPDEVVIASGQPFLSEWVTSVEHTAKRKVRRVIARPSEIARYLTEFYSLAKSVSKATADDFGNNFSINNFEQLLEIEKLKDPDANDNAIINIVDWLLQYAFQQRASDIHIEPRRDYGRVRFRIDGVLQIIYQLPSKVMIAVTARLKILSRMNVAERRLPQDGRIKTKSPNGKEIELRLSTLPTAFGEKMVMRIFDPDILLKSFAELGLLNDDFDRWNKLINHPTGIVLVTGPTGSGKTTTLYTSLKTLATDDVNVSTIEDPIEMVEESFNQMQVNNAIELGFADGVRALMRQDPDIIMIGEIRDQETADMALQAALTGHLVISTLHTNDAPTAVSRLLDLGVPYYLIRATMLGVMAQRLVRRLCPKCKEALPVDAKAWNDLTAPWKVNAPEAIYKPVGCLDCRNTGYHGREGIYEILVMSPAIKMLVDEKTDLSAVRHQAMREGMRTLRISGAQKVAQGLTTIEEVLRVTPEFEKAK
jgi:general secretion pathway protein E